MGEYKNSQSLAENSQSNHEEKTNMEIDNKTLKDKEKEITFLHDLNRQIFNELKDFESENERLKSLVKKLQTTDEDNANMQFDLDHNNSLTPDDNTSTDHSSLPGPETTPISDDNSLSPIQTPLTSEKTVNVEEENQQLKEENKELKEKLEKYESNSPQKELFSDANGKRKRNESENDAENNESQKRQKTDDELQKKKEEPNS